MVILYCNSITKPKTLASSSSTPPNNSTPSPSPSPHINHNKHVSDYGPPEKLKLKKVERPPSVLEIERAIGAGMFRDRDPNSGAEEKSNLFDNLLKNSIGKSEGSVERQLRESGEWLIHQSEKSSRSAGKQILMTIMFLWILPAWIFAFLLASGIVHLPIPFIEDMFS